MKLRVEATVVIVVVARMEIGRDKIQILERRRTRKRIGLNMVKRRLVEKWCS